MTLPALTSFGPTGASFTYNGTTYHVEPTSLSGRVTQLMRRRNFEIQSQRAKQALLDPQLADNAIAAAKLTTMLVDDTNITHASIIQSLHAPEILAEVLAHACPQLRNYQDALKLVFDYPDYNELLSIVIRAMGFGTLKNSEAPSSSGPSENENAAIRE